MNASGGEPARGAQAEALARIAREDAVGQLWRRTGEMARLGSEGDSLKLDWVSAVPWLLEHPDALATVEEEARALLARGVRHVIWAGMGGSVLTVRVLKALGYGDGPLTIYPLDSTDPAALNAIARALASARGLALPDGDDLMSRPDTLRALLGDVALVAVAMGMTSEEPISHIAWLASALTAAGLPLPDHLRVMSLPDSFLDVYARERGIPRLPLQLDGGSGTGGRMSAPGTRVFLLPVALWLAANGAQPGALAGILRRAWAAYDIEAALSHPADHRFVRLAAALSAASVDGAVRLHISAPGAWSLLRDWSEQLFEESLGKGGKGVVVFGEDARLPAAASALPEGTERSGAVWLRITGDPAAGAQPTAPGAFILGEPLIASANAHERLAGLASLFLGLQLTMSLYGYLHDITFAGQPAVEDYKARARALRDAGADPIPTPTPDNSFSDGKLSVMFTEQIIAAAVEGGVHDAVEFTARSIATLVAARVFREAAITPYLDLTINGEASPDTLAPLEASLRALAIGQMGLPYKLRRAPAAYHSTEQSEMDGPPWIFSLRALALRNEPTLLGEYTPAFLRAQAIATWQAMIGVNRICLLALYDGDTTEMVAALTRLLDQAAQRIAFYALPQAGRRAGR